MKILVLTNHLALFGGSEIVTLEVAETFSNIGCDVSIFSAYIDDPMRSYMDELDLKYGAFEDCPSPENFDIIWSQHHLLPCLLAKHSVSSIENVFLVNTSLSPYEPLEIPGAIAEVADMIVANSPETAERLIQLGVPAEKISVFYNAAPDSFNLTRKASPDLKRVLNVSNHVPEEVACTSDILRNRGITVDHIGLPSHQKKITPEIISSYDAIISIGKSVQYSLLCETPVYVYDRFGGPGWLNEANIAEAEKFNFSGRCCHRQLSPETIADELIRGYSEAISTIRILKQTYSAKYTLRNYLTHIIERSRHQTDKRAKRQIDPSISNLICREGLLSGQLVTFYQVTQHQTSKIAKLVSDVDNLSSEVSNLSALVSNLETARSNMETERQDLLRSHQETYILQQQNISEKSLLIDHLERNLLEMMNSASWRITKPLRIIKNIISR